MKIALETLGCKLNQAETELLTEQFRSLGHTIVTSWKEADLYLLNTCTVTHTADAKARHLLNKVRRNNPAALLVVTGCYPDHEPEKVAGIEGVYMVTGNAGKLDLPARLEADGILKKSTEEGDDSDSDQLPSNRTRTFIKIQDGCKNFCTYCIVPFVRPNETSVPADDVIDLIKQRAEAGFKEVVLTGTEVGTYASGDLRLIDLLQKILDETDIPRIRLSSLQPDEITPELVALWQDARLCPHFHVSLQSGSDAVLKRMNRRYTIAEYKKAIGLIRSTIPDAAVTTDIIAGFPGETDEDFEQSLEMCRNTGFARIHVFPYSKRPGTAAAKMSGQVQDSIKTERNRNLGEVSREAATNFREGYIGAMMNVLWEQKSAGDWSGYTGNYIRVYLKSRKQLTNEITPVKLTGLYRDGMTGELVE